MANVPKGWTGALAMSYKLKRAAKQRTWYWKNRDKVLEQKAKKRRLEGAKVIGPYKTRGTYCGKETGVVTAQLGGQARTNPCG